MWATVIINIWLVTEREPQQLDGKELRTMTMKVDWMLGCATALVTPFKAYGAIDEDRLRALVDRQVKGGVRLLVPCGTTAESATMTEAEDQRALAITLYGLPDRSRVISRTASNSPTTA